MDFTPMAMYLAEVVGTMTLVLLGDGVVANVVLNKTKGNSSDDSSGAMSDEGVEYVNPAQ